MNNTSFGVRINACDSAGIGRKLRIHMYLVMTATPIPRTVLP